MKDGHLEILNALHDGHVEFVSAHVVRGFDRQPDRLDMTRGKLGVLQDVIEFCDNRKRLGPRQVDHPHLPLFR